MLIARQRYSAEAFDTFIAQPENGDKLFELIAGEIIEVPSNPYSSFIGSIILGLMITFVIKHKLGYVTGEQGGYMVSGERYAPDVAFISFVTQKELAKTDYNPNPPDLAVEVFSPSDNEGDIAIKVGNYLAAGTVVWVVRADKGYVAVYKPNTPVGSDRHQRRGG